MNYKNFIGVDISKNTFDVAILKSVSSEMVITAKFPNNYKGIVALEELIHKQKLIKEEILFCMEHTGIYCRILASYLTENNYSVWIEMPVQILRSLGIQRGKNDKIDAQRIATYAYTFKDNVRLWQPPRQEVQKISDLLALRDRLIESRTSILVPIEELVDCGLTREADTLRKLCRRSLEALDKEIDQIEKELDKIINNDTDLKNKYTLAKSVPGIGKITALSLLYYTNGFTLFNSGKKLACYCGVAPFSNESGTSVKRKPRVSNFANKKLKKLLHMAALSAISSNKELRAYYDRKVAEGKNKMLVINAVRNKIILRLIAVINRGTPYCSDFKLA